MRSRQPDQTSEDRSEAEYVPLSPEALRALLAGLESAKAEPTIYSDEDFSKYAEDE